MKTITPQEFESLMQPQVERLGLCDVHEHLVSSRQRAEKDPDLFQWIASSYLWADLVSAGLDRDVLARKDVAAERKWSALAKYLPLVRHTGYMEACRYAWQDLCGMNGRHLDESNWKQVDEATREHNRSPAFKEKVLVQRCGMRAILVDYQVGGTAVYFFGQRQEPDWIEYLLKVRPGLSDAFIAERNVIREMDLPCQYRVVKIDSLLYGWLPQAAAENIVLLSADTSAARSTDQYSELIASTIRRIADSGAVGIKSAHSCCRGIEFGPINDKLVQEALRLPVTSMTREHVIAFENYAFQEIVRQAGLHRLPLQIHTGTTYGPTGLNSARAGMADRYAYLVQRHPQTQFVLMHGSWPYWGEIEQMAKRFPNVALDLSWSALLGPEESIRMITSLVRSVPTSKIMWGGDCYFAEESYGAVRQFRKVLATALSSLVNTEKLSADEAVDVAVQIFCRNLERLYVLKPKPVTQAGENHVRDVQSPSTTEQSDLHQLPT
jgi:predicted TIM-barrel fold metal-dependent hydrolase